MSQVREDHGSQGLYLLDRSLPAADPVELTPVDCWNAVIVVDGRSLLVVDCDAEAYKEGDNHDNNIENDCNDSYNWYFMQNRYVFLEDEEHVDHDGSDRNGNSDNGT